MTEQSDPARLKTLEASAPELKRALQALGSSELDAARLSRVADALGPLLDAPPPAHGLLVKTALRLAQSKLVSLRIGLATLVIGSTAYWWSRHQDAPPPVEDSSAFVRPAERAPTPVVEAMAPAEVASEPMVSPNPAVAAPVEAPKEAPTTLGRVRRAHHRQRATAQQPVQPAPVPTVSPVPAPSQGIEANTYAIAARAADHPAPKTVPEDEPAQPPARKRSEVQLLQQARAVIDDDPHEALELLAEHATRFSDGLLAPEREVLAIEALRKMGDTHAADKRLRAFRARYPDSLHLRRLERRTE